MAPPAFESFDDAAYVLARLRKLRTEFDAADAHHRRTCSELYPKAPQRVPPPDARGMAVGGPGAVLTDAEGVEHVLRDPNPGMGRRIPARWPTETPDVVRRRLGPEIGALEYQLRRLAVIHAEKWAYRNSPAHAYVVQTVPGQELPVVHALRGSPALLRHLALFGPGGEVGTDWFLGRRAEGPSHRNNYRGRSAEEAAELRAEAEALEQLYGPCRLLAAGQDSPAIDAGDDEDDDEDERGGSARHGRGDMSYTSRGQREAFPQSRFGLVSGYIALWDSRSDCRIPLTGDEERAERIRPFAFTAALRAGEATPLVVNHRRDEPGLRLGRTDGGVKLWQDAGLGFSAVIPEGPVGEALFWTLREPGRDGRRATGCSFGFHETECRWDVSRGTLEANRAGDRVLIEVRRLADLSITVDAPELCGRRAPAYAETGRWLRLQALPGQPFPSYPSSAEARRFPTPSAPTARPTPPRSPAPPRQAAAARKPAAPARSAGDYAAWGEQLSQFLSEQRLAVRLAEDRLRREGGRGPAHRKAAEIALAEARDSAAVVELMAAGHNARVAVLGLGRESRVAV